MVDSINLSSAGPALHVSRDGQPCKGQRRVTFAQVDERKEVIDESKEDQYQRPVSPDSIMATPAIGLTPNSSLPPVPELEPASSGAEKSPTSAASRGPQVVRSRVSGILKHSSKYCAVQANHYNQVGNMHFRDGNMEAAKASYEQALQCSQDVNDRKGKKELVSTYSNLGTIHWRTGDTSSAIQLLQKALLVHSSLFKASLDRSLIAAQIHHQLGLCYALEQDFDVALEQLKKALYIRERATGNTRDRMVGRTLDAIGRLFFMQGQFDKAIHYHEKAILSNAPTEQVLMNIAHAYLAQGQRGEALKMLRDIHQLQCAEMEKLRGSPAAFEAAARRVSETSETIESLSRAMENQ